MDPSQQQELLSILLELIKTIPVYGDIFWGDFLPEGPDGKEVPGAGRYKNYCYFFYEKNGVGLSLPSPSTFYCRLWIRSAERNGYHWSEPMLIEDAKRYLDLLAFV